MIEVNDLSKVYGRRRSPAINELSFNVNDGEILGFAGLNGAGKTTTINCISGVLLPSKGNIAVDGSDIVREKAKASKNLGWVSEFPTFEQNVKPVQLLDYFAGFYNIPKRESQHRIEDILRAVGLESVSDRKIRTFSQGMKKRFGLATSMISDPQNYLLDEILNGLDPEGVHYVKRQMLDFKKAGKSVLLSTHILRVLEDIADRIVIIHDGRVKEIVSREKFRNLGKPNIRLKPNRIDKRLLEILESYGKPVEENDQVSIVGVTNAEKTAQEISAAVVKAGYTLSYLSAEGSSLEEYFLELMEGSREAGSV